MSLTLLLTPPQAFLAWNPAELSIPPSLPSTAEHTQQTRPWVDQINSVEGQEEQPRPPPWH